MQTKPPRIQSAVAADLFPCVSVELPTSASHLWSRTPRFNEILRVQRVARGWEGVAYVPQRNGIEFSAGVATIGHLRWSGRLDVPFPAELCDRLVTEAMAAHDDEEPGSHHVVFVIRFPADVDHALWLLRLAYLRWRTADRLEPGVRPTLGLR